MGSLRSSSCGNSALSNPRMLWVTLFGVFGLRQTAEAGGGASQDGLAPDLSVSSRDYPAKQRNPGVGALREARGKSPGPTRPGFKTKQFLNLVNSCVSLEKQSWTKRQTAFQYPRKDAGLACNDRLSGCTTS